MKFVWNKTVAVLLGLFLVSGGQGGAVVVAGANGGGNNTNNTSRAQMESATGTVFNAYENVVRYAGGSAVYLGYNPSTFDVWLITARHNTNPTGNITLDGKSYTFQERVTTADGDDSLGDLELLRYKRTDNAVPSLPAVQLSSTTAPSNATMALIGLGQNRVENAATNANVSDASSVGTGLQGYNWTSTIKRWGLNTMDSEFPDLLESGIPTMGRTGTYEVGGVNSVGFTMDFDRPANGQWLTSNEAIGSPGDSGGGVFYFNGSGWELNGLISVINASGSQNANTSAFGNLTIATDIATYRSALLGNTGILVPEPSTALLVLFGSLTLLRRKRS